MKITFLGAGVFGSALANIARDNGHEIKFYDPFKYPDINLHDATNGSDLNVFTAPSSASTDILPELDKDTPLIIASKGFVSLKPFQDFKDISALGGAGFADEIENSKKTTFTASTTLAETIFSTEEIHIEYTPDTLGILLCGALKNVYAIGAGLYGESESDSASMPYLEVAISEIIDFLIANQTDKNTLRLSCGAPDLVLSCSQNSRNFRFGKALKDHVKPEDTTVEGLAVINSLNDYPEFIVPKSTNLFNDIVNTVKEYYATK